MGDHARLYLDVYNWYRKAAAIFCPLIIDRSLIGVMTAQTYEKNFFTMLKVEMIKALSYYAAIAINNAMSLVKYL